MKFIYIKSFMRKDYLIFYLWISSALVGAYLVRSVLSIVIALGAMAGFVAYLRNKPPRIISVRQFIKENGINNDLIGKYFDVFGSEEGDTYFRDSELSKMLITKMLAVLRDYEEYDTDHIYCFSALFYKHWTELEFYLNNLPEIKSVEKLTTLLNAFSFSLNAAYINSKNFFSLFGVIEKILNYIFLNRIPYVNNNLLDSLNYCEKKTAQFFKVTNYMLKVNMLYDNTDEYRISTFRQSLNNYNYLLNTIITFEKMQLNGIFKGNSINELLFESESIISQLEYIYKNELNSKSEQKVLIAMDVLSCTEVINSTLMQRKKEAK